MNDVVSAAEELLAFLQLRSPKGFAVCAQANKLKHACLYYRGEQRRLIEQDLNYKLRFRILKEHMCKGKNPHTKEKVQLILEKGDLLEPTGWGKACCYARTTDVSGVVVRLMESEEGERYETVHVRVD